MTPRRHLWSRARWIALGAIAALVPAAATASEPGWLRQAIAQAAPGAVIDVPAGVHVGPFIIEKTIHLRGAPGATLEGTGEGHVIEVLAPDVEISGLLLRRSGANLSNDDAGIFVRAPRVHIHDNTIVDTLHGIYLLRAPEARLVRNVIRGRAGAAEIADPLVQGLQLSNDEMCSVDLQQDQRGNGIHIWNCGRHLIEENDIRGTRDGIYFSFCDETVVRRNHVEQVRYGLHYMYSDENVFEENRFTRNAAGSALMYSSGITLRRNAFLANRSHRAYGLLFHTVDRTRVEDNTIEGNTIGLFLENSLTNTVAENRIAANYIGVHLSASSDGNVFTGNRLHGNVHPVESDGPGAANAWSAGGRGNYWQDAVKLDLDRSGIADVPHFEADLFGPWRRTFPEIGLLSGSPGERAIRFMHARLRLPQVPGVRDERPLAR